MGFCTPTGCTIRTETWYSFKLSISINDYSSLLMAFPSTQAPPFHMSNYAHTRSSSSISPLSFRWTIFDCVPPPIDPLNDLVPLKECDVSAEKHLLQQMHFFLIELVVLDSKPLLDVWPIFQLVDSQQQPRVFGKILKPH